MKIVMYNIMPKGGKPPFEAFKRSILADGHNVIEISSPEYIDCDAIVIWSVLGKNHIIDMYKDTPKIIMEVGALKRNEYWRVGINGINNNAIFNNDNSPSDRWDLLGMELKHWRTNGDYILICGQNQRSGAWSTEFDMKQWLDNTITEIRKYSDRKIIVRPHPRAYVEPSKHHNVEISKPILTDNTDIFDLKHMLSNCWAVINYNSNPAIESIIEGVPVFVDRSSLAYQVSSGDIANLEKPICPSREQWAYNMAYIEWSVPELENGTAWNNIKVKL